MAQGLVNVSNCNFNIFLSNLTEKAKFIESDSCVGRLTPAEDYTCIVDEKFLNSFFDEKEKFKEKRGTIEVFLKKEDN